MSLSLLQLIFVSCAKIKEFSGVARAQGYAITLGQSIEVGYEIISFNQFAQCFSSYLDNRPQSTVSIFDEVDG